MTISCLGINHRTASVELREKLAFAKTEIPEAARRLVGVRGTSEAVLVSTCNRLEVYVAGEGGPATRSALLAALRASRRLSGPAFARAAYAHEGTAAVRHLVEVTAGLDSQVVGEPQILSQIKDAHAMALAAGATGTVLNGLFNRAVAAGKRVRTETEIGRLPASVSSVAVDLAERIFGGLADKTVLLLGTGETAVLVAENLVDSGAPRLLVASVKSHERAVDLAGRYRGEAVRLADAPGRLADVDIVIAATGGDEPVIRAAQVAGALHARRSRPLFLVDLGLPRNIEAGVADLPNAYLYNLDDLKALADENLKRREAWVAPARAIVAEAVDQAVTWLDGLDAVPTIQALRAWAEEVRREVLAKAGRPVRDLPPAARAEVEYLTQALVNKLLHRPISALKDPAGAAGATSPTDLLRRLFGLK